MPKREPDIREEQLDGIESLVKKFHNDFIENVKTQKNKKDIKLSDIKSDKGSLVALVKEIKADNKLTRENFISTFFNNTENIISAIDDLSDIIGGNLGNIEKLQEEQVKETKKVKKKSKKKSKKKKKKDEKPQSEFDKLFGPKAKDVQFSDFIPDEPTPEDKKKSKGLFSALFRGIFSGLKKLAFGIPDVEDVVDKFQKFWKGNIRKALFSPFKAMKFLVIRGAQEIVQVTRGTADDLKKLGKPMRKVFGIFSKGTKGVAKVIRSIGLAFKLLGGPLKLVGVLIVLAIAAIGFAIFMAIKQWKKIKDVFKKTVSGITDWVVQKWEIVKEKVSDVINWIGGLFTDLFKGIKEGIKIILGETFSKFVFGDEKEGAVSDATKASSSEKENQKKVEAQDQTRMIREVSKISGMTPLPQQQNNEDVVNSIKKLTSTMDKKDMGGTRQISSAPASNIDDLGTILATRE